MNALTKTEITPGAAYIVSIDAGLSHKRFGDAVALVKGIGGYEGSTAAYEGSAKAWTVTLAADAQHALWDLQTAVKAYGAIVKRA